VAFEENIVTFADKDSFENHFIIKTIDQERRKPVSTYEKITLH
jgi:hypothetical protein